MKLKREIDKTIGSTKEHEENVWRKLSQRQQKKRYPLFISLATAALACIILAISLWPADSKDQANPVDLTQNEAINGIPFIVRHYQDNSTWNIERKEFVLTATNQQELDHWLNYLEIDAPAVNFDGYFVMITQFFSDGCGLVVENLQPSNDTLNIRLDLPPDLRKKAEIMCTLQEMPNIQILQVPIFQGYKKLTTAHYTGIGDNVTVTINELNIDELYYNFGLAHDYVLLDKAIVNDIKASQQFVFQNEASLQTLTNTIFRATEVEEDFHFTSSDYQLIVQHQNGKELMIHVLVDVEKNEIIFVSEITKNKAFIVKGEEAKPLIALFKQ